MRRVAVDARADAAQGPPDREHRDRDHGPGEHIDIDRHARSLARRAAQMIGVSFAEQERSLSGNPYVADVLDGMMQSASENSYNIALFTRLPSVPPVFTNSPYQLSISSR